MSSVEIRNCLISGNSASNGGGIYNTFGGASITNTAILSNNTVFGGGGVISENSEPFLSNCILWGNVAGSVGQQILISGPILTIEYSTVQGGLAAVEGCCNWEIDWGPGMIDADPLFADAEIGDYHLLPGSPCIDAGDNTAVPPDLLTDLDGFARFADDPATPDTGNPWPEGLGVVDMGPYEFGGDDCNNNGIPDSEDVAKGGSDDCDANNIPDECEPDCNANGQADICDLAEEGAEDCDDNGIPDECQTDCNANGQPDVCDLADGTSDDCNLNDIPDECEVTLPIIEHPEDQQVEEGDFVWFLVEVDGYLLEYQWRKDGVDLVDTDRILGSAIAALLILEVQPSDAGEYDCVITDLFGCENTSDPATLTIHGPCPADFNDDGAVGPFDLAIVLGNWGPNPNHPADLNDDDIIDASDLALLLGAWGPCE